jgi:hypothetical protein
MKTAEQNRYDYWITRREQDVIDETMLCYDFTSQQRDQVRTKILERATKGGRFYPYHATHAACASVLDDVMASIA